MMAPLIGQQWISLSRQQQTTSGSAHRSYQKMKEPTTNSTYPFCRFQAFVSVLGYTHSFYANLLVMMALSRARSVSRTSDCHDLGHLLLSMFVYGTTRSLSRFG